MCGRTLDAHNQHFRFNLPEPVLDAPERERTPGTWMSHADARSSVMMQVPNVGPFMRALLPVRLTGGYTVTFGVWLAVHPDDLQHIAAVWWEPDYARLVVRGWLANTLPVWGLLAKPVLAVVRDPEQTPYCTESPDETLAEVLSAEWPHDLVLDAISSR
jgi:hypothetical protein